MIIRHMKYNGDTEAKEKTAVILQEPSNGGGGPEERHRLPTRRPLKFVAAVGVINV